MPLTVSSRARSTAGSAGRPRGLVLAQALGSATCGGAAAPGRRRARAACVASTGLARQQLVLAGRPRSTSLTVSSCSARIVVEDVAQLLGHQRVDVVPGDAQVGLGQRHRHVGQERAEEVPAAVHLVEHVAEPGLARGRQPGARRRTSRARSAATASSRTPTGSRAGPSSPAPASGRRDGREPMLQRRPSSSTGVDGEEVGGQVGVVDQRAVAVVRGVGHDVHHVVPAGQLVLRTCAGARCSDGGLERRGQR